MSSAPVARHVLRNRDFGLFLGGRFFAVLASQMQSVAVGWTLYDLTGDPMALGWGGLAAFLPVAAFTLPAGDLADHLDRRRILGAAHLLQAAAAGLLLYIAAAGITATWPFYVALALTGTTRALSGPAQKSFAPLLVPRAQFAQSVAWETSMRQIATIGGPALGGVIYLLGAAATFATCFALALIAAAAMVAIRTRAVAKPEAGTTAFSRLVAGLRYLRTQPVVFGSITLDLFAVLLGGVTVLLPVFARDILEVGPDGLGVMRSMVALGAVGTGLFLAQLPTERQPHAGRAIFLSVALYGAAIIVFGLSSNLWLSLAALAVIGGSDMVSVFVRATVIQLGTPEAMRGRVSAVHVLFVGATSELGEFRGGLVAAWLGAVPAVLLGGASTLAVVMLWMRLFPALRRIDRLAEVGSGR